MFNDERINFTLGKIYKRCIIFALLITSVICAVRSIYYTREVGFIFHVIIPDILIIIAGALTLLGELLFVGVRKDERICFKRSNYYRSAFVVFIFVMLCALAVSIPIYCTIVQFTLSDAAFNGAFCCTVYICIIYMLYSFKSNKVNINYSIIEKRNKEYYRSVLANIFKINLMMLPSCIISVVLTNKYSFIHGTTDYTTAIGVSIVLLLVVSGLYLLLSIAEKHSYDTQEQNNVLDRGEKLLFISNFTVFTVRNILSVYEYILLSWQYEYTSAFHNKITVLLTVQSLLWVIWTLLSVASLSCFLKFKQNKLLKITVSALILTECIDLLKNIFNSFFDALSIEFHAKILKSIIIPFDMVWVILECVLFFVLVYVLIREGLFEKRLLVSPIIFIIACFSQTLCIYVFKLFNIIPPAALDTISANQFSSFIGLIIKCLLMFVCNISALSVFLKNKQINSTVACCKDDLNVL